MNGIHDLGGMDGFGAIEPDRHEQTDHERWERTVFALAISLLVEGHFSLDEFRYAIERIDPTAYLTSSYYQRWLQAVETLLQEKNLVQGSGRQSDDSLDVANSNPPDEEWISQILQEIQDLRVKPTRQPPPEFEPGTRVRVKNQHPEAHTRHPRYVRGSSGRVEEFLGCWPLADEKALGNHPSPEPLYSVVFKAEELWGEATPTEASISLDLWESYLESIE